MEKLPTLYKKTSAGKIQEWAISVDTCPLLDGREGAAITTTYGVKGGKHQTAFEIIAEGKNIGKANETSPFEQAQAEAKAQWEKKVKKSYVENIEDAEGGKINTALITGGVNPMLAHSYEKQSAKIKYPAFVQPKLDGHRCIAIIQDGKCTLWSRTRKPIKSMPHIVAALEEKFGSGPTLVLDGELYNHEYREKFEQLTSLIRQETPAPGHEKVQYWIYDVANHPGTFFQRKDALDIIDEATSENPYVYVLATFHIEDEADMMDKFQVFLDNEYEGAIVRNAHGKYEGKRSYNLQKVKIMQDAEFEVIRIEEGRGKMAGRALFVCKTDKGKEFRVKMKGALDDLVSYFENQEPWIGKMLTVQFQKWSAEGIPVFPVALRFRKDV
jgi:DNA ligase-1